MDRKAIAERKAALEQDRDRLLAQLNATIGHIAECDFWLAEFDKPPEPTPNGKPAEVPAGR